MTRVRGREPRTAGDYRNLPGQRTPHGHALGKLGAIGELCGRSGDRTMLATDSERGHIDEPTSVRCLDHPQAQDRDRGSGLTQEVQRIEHSLGRLLADHDQPCPRGA